VGDPVTTLIDTATHYEILGVTPGASHDEIKRAYLDRALRYHPDRQVDQTPAGRQQAEFRMRELNGAWEVLRSPGKRAEYDARLRGDVPVWNQGRERAKRTAPVSPRVADLEPERPGGGHDSTGGWRVGPIVAVVLVVVAGLGFAAWATTSSDDREPEVQVQAASPYEEGNCVVLASVSGRITAVPTQCSAIGALQIDEVIDLGRPCAPGREVHDVFAEEIRLCLQPS
jgi:hypothetical protein